MGEDEILFRALAVHVAAAYLWVGWCYVPVEPGVSCLATEAASGHANNC